jgi:hypothetical protein
VTEDRAQAEKTYDDIVAQASPTPSIAPSIWKMPSLPIMTHGRRWRGRIAGSTGCSNAGILGQPARSALPDGGLGSRDAST